MDAGATSAPPAVLVPSDGQTLDVQFVGSQVCVNSHHGVSPPRSPLFWWSVYQAVAFVLVYTGYNSAQGVIVTLLPEAGTTTLAIIYYCFGTSSMLLGPLLLGRVNPKWLIALGFFFHLTFLAALLSGIAGVVYAASVFVGVGLGLVWCCEGVYVNRTLGGPRAHNLFWLVFYVNWVTAGVVGGLILTFVTPQVFLGVMLGVCSIGCLMSCFARSLPAAPGEKLSEFTFRGLFRSLLLLREPKFLLMLSTALTRASGLSFFVAKLPALIANLQVVPYVILTFALALIAMQTILLFAFARLPVWLWSALHTFASVAAMVLVACSGLVASLGTRLYIFYVVGGLLGAAEALALVLLNVFVSSLFPEDPSSVFGLVRGLEAYWIGSYILICGFTVVWVPIGGFAFQVSKRF
jgi:hypothetical protein